MKYTHDQFRHNKYGKPEIGYKEVAAEFPETDEQRKYNWPALKSYESEWVPVHVRLPEPHEVVRLRRRDKNLGDFNLTRYQDRGYFWWRCADGEIVESWEVTHWALKQKPHNVLRNRG